MKLHLPSSLRKALMACLAALALPSFTLSLGSASSLLGGAAFFSFVASQSAEAFTGPAHEYVDVYGEVCPMENDSSAINIDRALSGNAYLAFAGNNNGEHRLNFSNTDGLTNLKLDVSTGGNVSIASALNISSLWLTSSKQSGAMSGLLALETGADLSSLTELYVDTAQLWFRSGSYNNLQAHLNIGECDRAKSEAGLDRAALRIGVNVTTSGRLKLQGNAVVAFQGSGTTLTVYSLENAANADGSLTLSAYSASGNSGVLELNGSGGASNGSLNGTLTVGAKTTLRINVGNDNGGWQQVRGALTVDAAGSLDFVKGEFDLHAGGNINGQLTSTGRGKITLQGGTLNINARANDVVDGAAVYSTIGGLDIGAATLNILRDLKVLDRGLRSRGSATINVGNDEGANATLVVENTKWDDNNGKYGAAFNLHAGSTFIKRGDVTQSLTGTTVFNGSVIIESGVLELNQAGNLTIGDTGSIDIYKGATLKVKNLSVEQLSKLSSSNSGSGCGILEWAPTGATTTTSATLAKNSGLMLKVNTGSTWSTWTNCDILTDVQVATGQFVATGTSTVGRFVTEEGDEGQIVVEWTDNSNNTLVVGGEGYGDSVSRALLKVGKNGFLKLGSNLTINGIENKMGAGTVVSQENRVAGLTINNDADHTADVTFDISGSLTKSGNALQTLGGAISVGQDLVANRGELKMSNVVQVGRDMVVNGGTLVFDSNGSTTSVTVNGELKGSGGEVRIANKPLILKQGGTYSGMLAVSWDGAVELGGDLEIGGIAAFSTAVNNEQNNGSSVYNGIIRSSAGTTATLTINGGSGTEGNTMFSRRTTFESGVNLVKTGEGTQLMREVQIGGDLSINAGTLLFDMGESVLSGSLSGSGGELQVKGENSLLTIEKGGSYSGLLRLTGGASLMLDGDLTVNGLQLDSGANKINGSATFTVNVDSDTVMPADARLTLGSSVTLAKSGAGTWELSGVKGGKALIVEEGMLLYTGGDFHPAQVLVEQGASFAVEVLNASQLLSSTNVRLRDGGELKLIAQSTAQQAAQVTLNELAITDGGTIVWADQENEGSRQALTLKNVTGTGTLELGALDSESSRTLTLSAITDFDGTIHSAAVTGGGKLYIGQVNQAGGKSLTINVGDSLVHSRGFRKQGEGSLSVTRLMVENGGASGGLWMNYEGSLNIGELSIQNGTVLHYSTGEAERVIRYELANFYNIMDAETGQLMKFSMDVMDVSSTEGVWTGFVGTGDEDLEILAKQLVPLNGEVDYTMLWRDDKADASRKMLCLYIERFNNPDNRWDPDWGTVTSVAPSEVEMHKHEIAAADVSAISGSARNFFTNSLTLNGDNPLYKDATWGRLIRVVSGPQDLSTATYATIIGGDLYTEEPADTLETNTWISLWPTDAATANYHMLVGGSSCFSVTGSGGFVGDSHVQVMGGEVDYIVGGNHLTNTSFTFLGDSYISVIAGAVHGGIVGGSTITSSSGGVDVNEFEGHTRITIHTVLSNKGVTPAISAPDSDGSNIGEAFTAIVGGNAWIGVPTSAGENVMPSFRGSSMIIIDLLNKVDDDVQSVTTGNFDKAIVGGNYTAFSGDSGADALRSTLFDGTGNTVASTITIRATEKAVFTAGVNGASRRASSGGGRTLFEGNTRINIEGGSFCQAIAGGFWFESADAASVGDYNAKLTGNSYVSISGGHVWRAVGGSYLLGGSSNAELLHEGNSEVVVSAGRFSTDYGVQTGDAQTSMSFVAGGNFYRNSAGSANVHHGLSKVSIVGGEFDSVHIVGGDYVNSAAATSCAVTLTGGTRVSIGGAEDTAQGEVGDITMRSLVVGGSYLTDEKAGGSITIVKDGVDYATEVEIGERAVIEAEYDAVAKAYRHGGVAVVAGSVIMDEGKEVGGHVALIDGGTHLLVTGGQVSGHLVGGSYANESDSRNTLEVKGASSIELLGGSISGNVYGGHFSDNISTPDLLHMGKVSITLDGAEVSGNIVGGSYRGVRSGLAASDAPSQEAVQISLVSGSLHGDVYAAGWHDAVSSSGLAAHVDSTSVSISSKVAFGDADETSVRTVSGGFYKASASDASAVTGAAELIFSDKGFYENIANVVFRDFDTVRVDTNLSLAEDQLRVLDRGDASAFTKTGSGKLTLEGGLAKADGSAFSGKIWVNDGILAMAADQSLAGGIGFDLSARVGGNTKDTAYLQAVNGALLSPKQGGGMQVDLIGQNLLNGIYYLTGELTDVAGKSLEDIIDTKTGLRDFVWADDEQDEHDWELQLKNNCLVLRIFNNNEDEWYWNGGDSTQEQLWSNTDSANWSRKGGSLEEEVADVHFDGGALNAHVQIVDKVTPGNVFIDSGEFVFTQAEQSSSSGGLSIHGSGKLYVGTEGGTIPAQLELRLRNTLVPAVVLYRQGKLIISDQDALSNSTSLEFNGGILAYNEDEEGYLYTEADMSMQVSEASTDMVRVQVGRDDTTEPSAQSLIWGERDSVRSGDSNRYNPGIANILDRGIEKTGRGELRVNWTEDDNLYDKTPYSGVITSKGGSLVFHVVNTVSDGLVFGGDAGVITVADGAKVQFIGESSDGTIYFNKIDIARSFVSIASELSPAEDEAPLEKGRVIIGSDDLTLNNQVNYRISGDNSDYAGAIELRGRARRDSLTDSVYVRSVESLGGEQTTLILSGRNLVMEEPAEDAPTVISVGEVHVTAGTVTFLGFAQEDQLTDTRVYTDLTVGEANRNITLEGKLTGSGTLANARGGVNHVLTGDVSEFSGMIVAGAYGVGKGESAPAGYTGAYSSSSWTLLGEAPESGVILAGFGGNGLITIAYSEVGSKGVVIAGNIGGGEVYGDGTRLENSSDGTLIIGGGANTATGALIFHNNVIQLGDDTHQANWLGTKLVEQGAPVVTDAEDGDPPAEEKSAFVLSNGSLGSAMNAEGKGDVLLMVDTAKDGRVRVAQTAGELFDEVSVTKGGRLSEVNGSIVVGSEEGQTHKLRLGFDADSLGNTTGADNQYLINSNGGDIDLSLAFADSTLTTDLLEFDFTNEGFIKVLKVHRTNGAQSYLHVLAGGGSLLLGENGEEALAALIASGNYTSVFQGLGFKFMGVDQGDIIMSGSSKDVYLVLGGVDESKGDSHLVTDYNILSQHKATVIDENQTLTVSVLYQGEPVEGDDIGLHINNLVGLEGSKLHLKNASMDVYAEEYEAWLVALEKWNLLTPEEQQYEQNPEEIKPELPEHVIFVLNNELRDIQDDWALPDGVTTESVKKIDTYFEGSIECEDRVDIRKTGIGTLYVGMEDGSSGGITMSGTFTLEGGGLELRGASNSIGSLVFAYKGDSLSPLEEDRTLTVRGTTLTINDLFAEGDDEECQYTAKSLHLEEGGELIYRGAKSSIHYLSVTSDTKDGWLTIAKGESLTDDDEEAEQDSHSGKLVLEYSKVTGANVRVNESLLVMTGEGSGIDSARGQVVAENGELHLMDGAKLSAGVVTITGENGALDIHSTTGNVVHELYGDGALRGEAGGELTYLGDRSSVFSGRLISSQAPDLEDAAPGVDDLPGADDLPNADDLPGADAPSDQAIAIQDDQIDVDTETDTEPEVTDSPSVSMGAKLTIAQGKGTLTFRDVTSTAGSSWDIINQGNWVVDSTDKGKAIDLGNLTLASGSSTSFIYNPSELNGRTNPGVFHAESFTWEKGAKLVIQSSTDTALTLRTITLDDARTIKGVKLGTALTMEGARRELDLSLKGLPFLHYRAGDLALYFEEKDDPRGDIYLELIKETENRFSLPGMHKNAQLGAAFFWAVTESGDSYDNLVSNTSSDMYKMCAGLTEMLDNGRTAELEKALAAGAGASISVLSSSLMQDMQRQLSSIRNRTTTISADPGYDHYDAKPIYNVWINGESSYHKLSADSYAPGFSLSNWGGSVGVDMATSRSMTFGLAVSAMYGDLKSNTADSASGDMDTTYISLYARKAHGAWMHTFVMSAGMADVSLNRTVYYGSGSYTAKGSTDGSALGALYEIGYSKALNQSASAIIQTVFNVELRHVQIDGYTEKNTDAGLRVDDISQTALTFGAGVRAQAMVGENAMNRAAILEGRLLVKFDAGDRSGSATTRLVNGASVSGEVESAEVGAMGLEIGAGITIPTGSNSSVFFDASAEIRSGYTSLDANVGYRVSF